VGEVLPGTIFAAANRTLLAITIAAEHKAPGNLVVAQTSAAERRAEDDLPADSLAAAAGGVQVAGTPVADTIDS